MAFNESLQRARFTWMEARDKHQGAQDLHYTLSATGLLVGQLHELSHARLQQLYNARQEAWIQLQVESASAAQPVRRTLPGVGSQSFEFQRAFGEPANVQRLLKERTA